MALSPLPASFFDKQPQENQWTLNPPADPVQQQPGLSNITSPNGNTFPTFDANGQSPINGSVNSGYIQLDPNNPGYLSVNPADKGPVFWNTPTNTGGGGGNGGYGGQQLFQQGAFIPPAQQGAPSWLPQLPVFTPPSYKPPPAFSYKDFQGPSGQDVLNEPGYQFRLGQGQQSLQNARAAQGLINSGSTLKDILGYGQDYASNEFNNVWNRALTGYQTNRGNAVDTYNTNYQTQYKDPYQFAYQGAVDAFAPQMTGYQTQAAAAQHQNDQNMTQAWNQYLFDWQKQKDVFGANYQVATA